jgi:predicted hotdog family 3-hydroxylacyl-ACP dehydratase
VVDLQSILSHQAPMIMIDEVLENSHDQLVAGVTIRAGIPFYEPRIGVRAWVGLEYMAQSIAAFAGIKARDSGKHVPLGLIIGCRSYTCSISNFAPGSQLRIAIKELASEEFGLGSFDCEIGFPQCVAQGRVSVYGGDRHKVA